jgi:hypothetical protein
VAKHRINAMSFANVYPLYVKKVEKKGRTKAEVDEVIRWLTGYSQFDSGNEFDAVLRLQVTSAGESATGCGR